MTLISIIVPVYKVEKYLNKCIDSILNQNFKDFELILVDDGSPDACGKICDDYAKTDKRIKVIHKENGGLSSARNAGLEIAIGDYIGFVDSDDWIDPEMYDILYNNIQASRADISVCGVRRVQEKTNIAVKKEKKYKEVVLDQNSAFCVLFGRKDVINPYAWNKIYKKEIFNEIRYPEGHDYEDIYIISEVLLKTNRICITTNPLYNYLKRKDSITGNNDVTSKISRLHAVCRNYEIIKAKYPEYIDNIEATLYSGRYYVLDNMLLSQSVDIDEFEMIISQIKKDFPYVIRNKNITLKRKLSATCLMVSFKLYKLCVKFKYRK